MYKKELPRVSPEQAGLSSRMLLKMLKELEECGTQMHGFMLERHGCVAAECWWKPYNSDMAHICHSMGKSYVGTAVLLACTQGYLRLDDRIIDIFAPEIEKYHVTPNDNMRKLTVEHVLMMANGMSVHPLSGENLLENYLTSEFDHEPGTRFLYNTTGSCMLGAAVAKVTGKSVRQYLSEGVLDKIGVESDKLEWMAFHKNHIHAAPGVASSTENNLRLGMLYLRDGNWDGQQLLGREWVRKATTRRTCTDAINRESHLDDGAGYGYQLWICPEPEAFKFSGGHGQDVVMSRLNDLTISLNQSADDKGTSKVNEIISKYLLGRKLGEEALPEDREGYEELKSYLATRELPSGRKNESYDELESWNGIYAVKEGSIHINTELRPFDDINVYTDFYDHKDVDVKEISIYYRGGNTLELIFDDGTYRARIEASLDGVLRPVPTTGAIPIYKSTVSFAYAENGSLVVETKFLQTCFWTKLIFKHEGGVTRVEVYKERLHEDQPYIHSGAVLKKITEI